MENVFQDKRVRRMYVMVRLCVHVFRNGLFYFAGFI